MSHISPCYLRLLMREQNYKRLVVLASPLGGWLIQRKS